MKKRKSITILLILASIFLALGIGIITVGFVQGGHIYFQQQRFGPISTLVFTDKKTTNMTDMYTSNHKVISIQLDADLGDIIVEEGDEFSVEFKNFEDGEIQYKDNNGEIEIEASVNSINVSLSGINNNGRKIIVRVPKTCKEIEIDANLGSVNIYNLTLKKLDVNVDLGSVEAIDIDIEEADFDLNLGDLKFQGNILEKFESNAALGSLDIYLSGTKSDYGYDLKTDLGNISIDASNHHNYEEKNNSKPLISAKANLGDIKIRFDK